MTVVTGHHTIGSEIQDKLIFTALYLAAFSGH